MPTQNLYDSIALAENIKIQAKARNVQLKDMFAELDLSKGTLSNLRLGKKISADSLARIADYLDIAAAINGFCGRELVHSNTQSLGGIGGSCDC